MLKTRISLFQLRWLPFKVYLFSNYAGYLSTFSLQDRRTGSPSGILIIERHWPINSGQWPSMISISERLPASYPSTEELSSPADSVHTQIILGYIRIYYDILAYTRRYILLPLIHYHTLSAGCYYRRWWKYWHADVEGTRLDLTSEYT